jgi:metal-responsive CopG/Arc/MetJ family transcriptional regulator
MPRTIIDIPTTQLNEVDRLCRNLHISRAEAVRRGLAAFVEQHSDVTTNGFGLWNRHDARGDDASKDEPR